MAERMKWKRRQIFVAFFTVCSGVGAVFSCIWRQKDYLLFSSSTFGIVRFNFFFAVVIFAIVKWHIHFLCFRFSVFIYSNAQFMCFLGDHNGPMVNRKSQWFKKIVDDEIEIYFSILLMIQMAIGTIPLWTTDNQEMTRRALNYFLFCETTDKHSQEMKRNKNEI